MLDQLCPQASVVPVRVDEAPAEVHRGARGRDPTAGDELTLDLYDVVGRWLIGLLREELAVLLDLVEESEFVYVLETNGMILGNDPEYAQALAKYTRLHARVSIKGDSPEQYHELTGAHPDSYELPYKALGYLIDAGVSCNACLMASFSDEEGIERVKRKLAEVHPGILKSLEIERITMFPKVAERLSAKGLKPLKARRLRKSA